MTIPDPNLMAHGCVDRRKPHKHLVYYEDSPVRKDWDHPSPEEVAESLKYAHLVNRALVRTVNDLYDERDKIEDKIKAEMQGEIEALKAELKPSRLKNTILTTIFSSALASAILAGILTLARAFAK